MFPNGVEPYLIMGGQPRNNVVPSAFDQGGVLNLKNRKCQLDIIIQSTLTYLSRVIILRSVSGDVKAGDLEAV